MHKHNFFIEILISNFNKIGYLNKLTIFFSMILVLYYCNIKKLLIAGAVNISLLYNIRVYHYYFLYTQCNF